MKVGRGSAARLAIWLESVDTRSVTWLVSMSLMLFVLLLPFASFVAAMPFIQDEWQINNTQAGAIFSAYQAGFAVAALLVIPLTDRLEPRHILFGSATVSVIANVLFPIAADGVITASILRAVAGAGLVGVYVPGLRVISERFSGSGRGMAMGFFVTAFYAANSASLVATGTLMAWLSWREAYLALSLAACVGLPFAFVLLRGLRQPTAVRSSGGRLDLTVLKNRQVRYFILGYSLHAAELYAVRVWLPAFLVVVLVARGVESSQAAVTAATVGGIALAAGSIGPVMGGMISDRWGRAASAIAIFALSGVCSWIIGWMGDFPWITIVALSFVYGWAISADSAIYSTAITEVADPARLGSTMALQSFLGFMGGVIGPIVVGGILDVSPDSIKWGVGFSFVGLLSITAIVGLMRLRSMPYGRASSDSGGRPPVDA
ncbi:MAG: MFS transporter [Chloroflexi bacterium]|nr:MFS transporter [Chloroflexota bacterium]